MTIRTLSVMSPQDIRNLYLRALRCELIARGVPNPNVSPKSDYAVRAAALAQILAPCMANAVAAAEINMPDTCTGERLERWLAVYGLSKRPAKGSSGNIEYATEASSYVAVGQRLVDDQGQFYEVKTAATYANGALIPIEAISTGASTNRVAGTVLQWVTPPTYAKPKAKVATGGLADGADADKEEDARARLLFRMAYSEGGWQLGANGCLGREPDRRHHRLRLPSAQRSRARTGFGCSGSSGGRGSNSRGRSATRPVPPSPAS